VLLFLEQSFGARNRVELGCRIGPPGYIGCQNRFLGSLKISKYRPGFNPSILRHSGVGGAADEKKRQLNKVIQKIEKSPLEQFPIPVPNSLAAKAFFQTLVAKVLVRTSRGVF
jgi:hypothetical protein